jgi:hypothetical protein
MARIKILPIRLSAAEYVGIAAAAPAADRPLGPWIRRQALAGSRPPPDQPPQAATPPRSDGDKLTHVARTRLTAAQFETLAERSQACGLPVAALIRKLIQGLNPVPRRPIVRAAIVAVNRVGNNLNQLVHLAHTGIVLAPDLVRVLGEVELQFKALQDALIATDTDDAHAAEEGAG